MDILQKINEVIDPDYKPGGRYYREPLKSYIDKATGATITKKEDRSVFFYTIKGTKEQVDAQLELFQREFPSVAYGSSSRRISDTEAEFTRKMSAD